MIIHWAPDPELVRLFGIFSVRYYSLFFMIGLLIGYGVVGYRNRQSSHPIPQLDNLFVYILLGTVLGARLGHCLFYEPTYYLARPWEMVLPFHWGVEGLVFTGYLGLASHGGALGALTGIILFCRKAKVSMLHVLDLVAIGGPLTGAFIRLGNFMNSEIIGLPTDNDWGIVFSRVDELPRHPAQLYEALAYLLIFIILWIMSARTTNRQIPASKQAKGMLFGLVLLLVFGARFVLEYFKPGQVLFEQHWSLNMGQWLSLPFIAIGVMVLLFNPGRNSRPANRS